MPLPKYCSVATTLQAPGWGCAALLGDLSFACPFAHRAPGLPRLHVLTRNSSNHPSLHIADPAWQGPGWLGRVRDPANTWVLARREPDGFYYRAQIKAAPELESQRVLLVEFESPLFTGPKLPAQRQSVVSEEDVIQLSPFVEYSLRPGDKVLAAWEPGRQRYGPGIVLLGSEIRDNQPASKEEEITVHFWNGKTAQVPLGGVRWVPPTVWKKAMERLSKPRTSEDPSALLCAPCCSPLGTVTGGITNRLPPDTAFLCPPCHPQACCQPLCQGYCCPLMSPTWWPLTGTSDITARELPVSELKPAAQLLPLEGPKEEAGAVRASLAVSSSSSSSSCEEDLEENLEMGLPQTLMVNSAVNTDPILPKRPLAQSGPRQPEWRYWKRNGQEPRPGKPGIKCRSIQKDDNKQEKVQTAVVGTTKKLALKATMMPLQTLPEGAEYRKLGPGIIRHQQDKNLPNRKSPKDLGNERITIVNI
ncbi:uncharacterized protein C11orf16 homolog isoform X2 [Heterocephalus glaber]|uniref:Uncharacterized protein C11orf16 homolog isoform X2 n=1 Tax=Heterocephalus glaber TaxID=10181 RepID=A0AAX6PGL4_HETGA|nr:uncharacterized protein C11orf16 homolog isoform X2 [Heterocephalus glaber]